MQAQDRFSLDSRSLAQIRQNRFQVVDPYGTIRKRQRFRLWHEIKSFLHGFQPIQCTTNKTALNIDHALDLSHDKYALLFLVHT